MPLIRTDGLVKEFRKRKRVSGRFGGLRGFFSREHTVVRAVDTVSFALEEGELAGFLGPNGAGKSTTIKMLTGILSPTAGTAEVAGLVPWTHRERNARQIGVVFGQRSQLWWDLPLLESFRLIAKMYDVPEADYRRSLRHYVDLLDMGPFLDTPVRSLSLGQRMRGDLTAALLYRPRILFLDEPTVGLDVVAKQRIRACVAGLNRDSGVTVVLTTHDLDDVEELCRRIVLIDHGRVMFDGPLDRLKAAYAPHRVLKVHLAAEEPVSVPHATVVSRDGARVELRFDPAEISASRLINEVTERYEVHDLSVSETGLEDVLQRLYTTRSAGRAGSWEVHA